MFQSLGPGELFTIALVALIVFGPTRLPEMARKLGQWTRELRKAATEIRQGLDEEVRQLKEPLDEMRADLTKPVSEVKQSLAETADVVKKETQAAAREVNRSTDTLRASGKVEWVGPQPSTGLSPAEAWDGMSDPVPDSIRDAPTEIDSEDEAVSEPEAEAEPAGEQETDERDAQADA